MKVKNGEYTKKKPVNEFQPLIEKEKFLKKEGN